MKKEVDPWTGAVHLQPNIYEFVAAVICMVVGFCFILSQLLCCLEQFCVKVF